MKGDRFDPKGLIAEAYRIEGIGEPECRSIFLDWALSVPDTAVVSEAIAILVARHAASQPDHPMSAVLREGQAKGGSAVRRGGWRGRRNR